MVFDLSKTTFDIICVNNNIRPWISDPQVPKPTKEACWYCSIQTIELATFGCACHHVDRNSFRARPILSVENLPIRLGGIVWDGDKVGREEDVLAESDNPAWERERERMFVLLQHIFRDQVFVTKKR